MPHLPGLPVGNGGLLQGHHRDHHRDHHRQTAALIPVNCIVMVMEADTLDKGTVGTLLGHLVEVMVETMLLPVCPLIILILYRLT